MREEFQSRGSGAATSPKAPAALAAVDAPEADSAL